METKDIIYIISTLLLLGIVGYVLTQYATTDTVVVERDTTEARIPVEPDGGIGDGATPLEPLEEARGDRSEIGTSVDGNPIYAYHFGTGEKEILLLGGIHGGYSWNTSLLAYELIDHLDARPDDIPPSVMVTIIPSLNPDGLQNTVGAFGRFESSDALLLNDAERVAGRFNANDVDLNRNFDCEWRSESVWRSQTVSGGNAPLSEPESAALAAYVEKYNPVAAVAWFSAEGKVYPAACIGQPSDGSEDLAVTFADAAKYPTGTTFDAYAITGDMVNWLAKENVPAISVLLSTHSDTEFEKNWEGVAAVLASYAE